MGNPDRPGLVDTILEDVGVRERADEASDEHRLARRGRLPLLEFALEQLHHERDQGRRLLTHAGYKTTGGVKTAIAKHAETQYQRLPSAQQAVAKRVFMQLVRVARTEEGGDTSRRRRVEELGVDAAPVVQALSGEQARLLVTAAQEPVQTGGDDGGREATVELVHEALIGEWTSLRTWVNADREFQGWLERLGELRSDWEAGNQTPSYLLTGARLVDAQDRRRRRPDEFGPRDAAYIRASAANRRRGRLWAGLGAAAAALLVGAVVWWVDRGGQETALQRQLEAAEVQQVLAAGRELMDDYDWEPREVVDGLPPTRVELEGDYAVPIALATVRLRPEDRRWARPLSSAYRARFGEDHHLPGFGDANQRPGPPTWEADEALNARIRLDGGTFTMGGPRAFIGNEVQAVTVSPFYMQQHEVTNGEYRRFDEQHEGADALPVIYVSWFNAMAYAVWLGGVLPTEAQWEFAARGKEGRSFPWGDDPPTCELANYSDCSGNLVRVMSKPAGATPDGIHDLAGNVGEWCADWYNDYGDEAEVNPTGPSTGTFRVVRGGSFVNDSRYLRGANRRTGGPQYDTGNGGFRVVWSAAGGLD